MAQNGTPTPDLSTRQRRAIAALLSERDITGAARAARVGRRSLVRWLSEPSFRGALIKAEGEAIDQATRRLVGFQDSAVGKLGSLITSGGSEYIQLKAAQSVVDYLLKLRELRNLESRIHALEEVIFAEQSDGES